MKERPILFSGPMVRAILEGRKTVTRRVVNSDGAPGLAGDAKCPHGAPGDRLWVKENWRTATGLDHLSPSQIGESGELIGSDLHYEADGPARPHFGRFRPSMFMPRWASRLTLELVSVRVERLEEIDNADAYREGVAGLDFYRETAAFAERTGLHGTEARDAFELLWESINGDRPGCSWEDNPWVWREEFRVVEVAQ